MTPIETAESKGNEMSTETEIGRKRLIEELRELIDALDNRLPQLEREGETRIAGEAAALKERAVRRIAELKA